MRCWQDKARSIVKGYDRKCTDPISNTKGVMGSLNALS